MNGSSTMLADLCPSPWSGFRHVQMAWAVAFCGCGFGFCFVLGLLLLLVVVAVCVVVSFHCGFAAFVDGVNTGLMCRLSHAGLFETSLSVERIANLDWGREAIPACTLRLMCNGWTPSLPLWPCDWAVSLPSPRSTSPHPILCWPNWSRQSCRRDRCELESP